MPTVAGVDLSMRAVVGRFGIDHADVGVHDVTWLLITGPAGRAKKCVNAKILPNGSSCFTYARAGEISFAPSIEPSQRACNALGVPVNLTCN